MWPLESDVDIQSFQKSEYESDSRACFPMLDIVNGSGSDSGVFRK
jgi:hypothetical protein